MGLVGGQVVRSLEPRLGQGPGLLGGVLDEVAVERHRAAEGLVLVGGEHPGPPVQDRQQRGRVGAHDRVDVAVGQAGPQGVLVDGGPGDVPALGVHVEARPAQPDGEVGEGGGGQGGHPDPLAPEVGERGDGGVVGHDELEAPGVEAAGESGVETVVDGLEPGEEDPGRADVLAGADGVLRVLGALGAGEGHIEAGVGEVALVVGGVERGCADVAADDQGQGPGGPGHALVATADGEPGPAGEERRRGDAPADEQAPARWPGGGRWDGGLVVGGEDVGGVVRGDLLGLGLGLGRVSGCGFGCTPGRGCGLGLVRGVRGVGRGGCGHGCLLGRWWMGASAGGCCQARGGGALRAPNRPRAGRGGGGGCAPARAKGPRGAAAESESAGFSASRTGLHRA